MGISGQKIHSPIQTPATATLTGENIIRSAYLTSNEEAEHNE
jgi:hypothetical protein